MKLRNLFKREQRTAGMTLAAQGWPAFAHQGHFVNPERASQHVVIHRCVQLCAESLSLVPLRLYRHDANDDRTPAVDHPLYSVLQEQFNPALDAFAGREWLIASLLLHGNAYAKIELDGAGQVTALYPMAPMSVGVELLSNGQLRYNWTRADGGNEVLLQEEVLQIRYRTRNGWLGISPIQHAGPHIALALTQLDQVESQTKNGFRAPGALVCPVAIPNTARDNMRVAFKNQYQEYQKAGTPMLMDGGWKWEGFSIPNKDSEFLESRKLSNLDLCRIYGVPPSAVGITDNATYSNIGEESRALVARCLAPLAARIEQAMNLALLTPASRKILFVEHDLQGLLRGDMGARYAAYAIGRNGGWLSANEIRRFENLPAIEGGDEYLSPLNMTPAGVRISEPSVNA